MSHIPVLLTECIDALNIQPGGVYVDCTTNRGGHSVEIAKKLGTNGTLVCIDLDNQALAEAKVLLASVPEAPKYHFVTTNFRHLETVLKDVGISKVSGVLADLGISSQELDSSGRGFTFRFDEPLHMTFSDNPSESTVTAKDIVNDWAEESIADILYGYADERYSRRIAKAIVDHRRGRVINTTFELVSIIESSVPSSYKNKKTHCGTKTFQALRMAVNDELGSVTDLVASLPNVLLDGGRAAIITFHSTEDRVVKQALRLHKDLLLTVNKKAIMPSFEETKQNPRARSAQLRIVEKLIAK